MLCALLGAPSKLGPFFGLVFGTAFLMNYHLCGCFARSLRGGILGSLMLMSSGLCVAKRR